MKHVAMGVAYQDGRLFLQQRLPRSKQPWLWEFPGGKVEPGETPREALLRELQEELGVDAAVGELVVGFSGIVIDGEERAFSCYLVKLAERPTVTRAGVGFGWFSPREAAALRQTPANVRAWPNVMAALGFCPRGSSMVLGVDMAPTVRSGPVPIGHFEPGKFVMDDELAYENTLKKFKPGKLAQSVMADLLVEPKPA